MEEINKNYTGEIDLIATLKLIWSKKIKILLITFLVSLIGFAYLFFTPDIYKFSATISPPNSGYFLKYKYINDTIIDIDKPILDMNNSTSKMELDFKSITEAKFSTSKTNDHLINNDKIFSMFIEEFNDYNEVKKILKSEPLIKLSLNKLNKKEQDQKLAGLAKLMFIKTPENPSDPYTIHFKWNNVKTGKMLLSNSVDLTLLNVKKRIKSNLLETVNARKIKINRTIEQKELYLKLEILKQIDDIRKKIIILDEQSNIARELGISNSRLKNIYFNNNTQNKIAQFPLYLRGYIALDKEISLLKKRNNSDSILMSKEATQLKYELEQLKSNILSNQLLQAVNEINKDNHLNWLNFDIDMADTKFNKKFNITILISLILGLVFGSILVVCEDAFKKHHN